MRRDIDAVEIKEPPLKHLKRGSCAKRCCVWSAGVLFAILLAFFLLLKYAAKPRPKELADLPAHFPTDISIYDRGSIDRITILAGKDRGRIVERFALLPKVVIAPIVISIRDKETPNLSAWERFLSVMKKPVTDHRDIVEMEWSDLSAQPKFLQNYFHTALGKEAYEIIVASETDVVRQFTFSKDGVDGVLYIRDDASRDGTDYLRLTVRIPATADN